MLMALRQKCLGRGSQVHMSDVEVPGVIANRYLSSLRRIGVVPLFSLQKAPVAPTSVALSGRTAASSYSGRDDSYDFSSGTSPYARAAQPATLPMSNSTSAHGHSDELGYTSPSASNRTPASAPNLRQGYNESLPTGRRRSSAAGGTNRFTIVNAQEGEIPEEDHPQPSRAAERSRPASPPQWPTAEDEKTKLYQQAKADVARVQGHQPVEREPSVRVGAI